MDTNGPQTIPARFDLRTGENKATVALWFIVGIYAIIIGFLSCCLIYRGLNYYVSVNSNEGWNAGQALRLFRGEALYPNIRTFIGNNYPPVSFVLTAMVMHIVPDPIFAGRVVSIAGFLAIPLAVHGMARRIGCSPPIAVIGATLFPAYLVSNEAIYVAVDDPQLEAYALLLLGAALVIIPGLTMRRAVTAAIVITMGLFIKHNSVGIVLALAIWLLLTRPRHAIVFAVAGMVSSALALLICLVCFGHEFIANILAPRSYSLLHAWRAFYSLDPALLLLGILAAAMMEMVQPDDYTKFFRIWLLLATSIGLVTSTSAGVGSNAYFEIPMAAGPAIGYGLHKLQQMHRRGFSVPILAVLASAAALMGPSLSTTKDMFALNTWLDVQNQRQASTLAVVHFLADHPGPALCQVAAYCVWAGKGFGVVAPYNFPAAVIAGKISDAPVVQGIAAHMYSAIIVPSPGIDSGLTSAITAAMHAYYRQLPMPGAMVTVFVPDVGKS